MYVDNLRVVESTFEKSAAIEDNPNTTGYYESQRQTFGTGAYNETRYKIVNKTVKTHLVKQYMSMSLGTPQHLIINMTKITVNC